MRRNRNPKPRILSLKGISLYPVDIAMLILSAAVFIAATAALASGGEGRTAAVHADGGEYLFDMDNPGEHAIRGPLGDTIVEIGDDGVRILSSPCRDQICVAAGWLSQNGDWAACLPNKVFLRVEADHDHANEVYDAYSY